MERTSPASRAESLKGASMTADEFREWKERRGYTSGRIHSSDGGVGFGLVHAAADLCVPKNSISVFLHDQRRVPPDVARMCQIIDVLDLVAWMPIGEVPERDKRVVNRIRDLLSEEIKPPLPAGHWAWQELRIDRLCRLVAAVQSLTCTTSPRLAKARRQAVEMIKMWGGEHANQN